MIEVLEKHIHELFAQIGYLDLDIQKPPQKELGDFAIPLFSFAKENKQSPGALAEEAAAQLQAHIDTEVFVSVVAAGPYINITFKNSFVCDQILTYIDEKKDAYAQCEAENPKKIMIEYPSNNTHKEFHIGHLRNVCIGNTLVMLQKKMGNYVIPVNYLNDFGVHVAKCLWWITTHVSIDDAPENKQRWLGEMYAAATRYLKEYPEKNEQVSEMLNKLESKDSEVYDLFLKTRIWSTDAFEKIFSELHVVHEKTFFESEIKSRGHEIVDTLLEKGIAQIGERGAVIVDLSEHGLDIALLRKSDGNGVYATSDLALAEKKFADKSIDESIVITGTEQIFYFKQLFQIFSLLKYTQKNTHIAYGLIVLPEGKMSSRAGTVVLYEDIKQQIFEYFIEQTQERHTDWHDEAVREVAKRLTLAVLKFSLLKHEAKKDIVFNFDEVVSMDGYSAPYVLYSIARINSISAQVTENAPDIASIDTQLLTEVEAKELALVMNEYPQVIKKAAADYNPSVITRYCYELASAVNTFYAHHSVMHAPSAAVQKARLFLLITAKKVLEDALSVLTIDPVQEM